jgi:hypothetical protein
MLHVKAVLWLREFAYGASPEILNPLVALQVWAGTPVGILTLFKRIRKLSKLSHNC